MSCWSDCVRSASHVRLRVTTPKKCVWECLSVHISRSDCHSPIVKSTKTKTISLRYLICVATTRRFEFVSFFFFKNECRDIRCDRLLSLSLCLWWKIFDEGDHGLWRRRWTLISIGLWGLFFSCVQVVCFQCVLRSSRCGCFFFGRVERLCISP